VNPPPVSTSEPLLSLPMSAVVLVLLLLVSGTVLASALLARHLRRRFAPVPSPPDQTPPDHDRTWLISLLDELPQGALLVEASGRPLAWNQVAFHTLSMGSRGGGLPLPLATLIARVLNAGTAETTEITASDGADRRVRVTASPLGSAWPGGKGGVLVLIHTSDEDARNIESYRRLISALAHELRTPLTAILGHADILGSCDREKDEGLWRRSRDFIASEAERLAHLVEDLLTLSRLDLTSLERRPLNLRAVVEEAISALFQVAEARKVRLALQSPPTLPRILGDRDRLYQVFLNLLDNAIKYANRSGGEAFVRLTPGDRQIQVKVWDNGLGIASQDLPHIFDPLYRSPDVSDTPGTGLGLTIVRSILEQHGATIRAQSEPGQGTAFHFSLPCAE